MVELGWLAERHYTTCSRVIGITSSWPDRGRTMQHNEPASRQPALLIPRIFLLAEPVSPIPLPRPKYRVVGTAKMSKPSLVIMT